jgi:possible relaxase
MLKDLKKEDFIKGLKELVEHLEVNKEVDLDNFNNEVLKFAYSNKKPFEEVVKECVLKEMKTYIDDCELDKKCNIHSVVSDYFMPDNKYGYFPNLDENLALLEQIHYEDSDLADEIVAEVKEQIRYSDESPKSELNSMVEYNYTEAGYYMEFAMQKVLEKEIMSAKELIQEIDGMEDYEIDEDLSRGDYKALYNSLAEKEVYSKEEIKQDLLMAKDDFNKEEMGEKTDVEDYVEEYNFYEDKNKDLDEENLKGLRSEIKNFQKNILLKIKTEKLEKISEEEYRFKDDILENKWGEFGNFCDKICNASEFPFEKYMTSEEAIKRYDLEEHLAPFQIINGNDDILFDSKEKTISDNLQGFIITTKGEEYLNNMDISNIKDWENLNLDIVFKEDGKKHIYIEYDRYIEDTSVYEKLIEKMAQEVDFYANEVKKDLLKYKTDDIIKIKDFENLEQKYDKEAKNEDIKEIEQEIDSKKEIEKDF